MRLTIDNIGPGPALIDRELMRFSENLAFPLAAWQLVGTALRQIAEAQFDTEGGYASGGWAPLAQSTIDNKKRLGLDPHILRATDDLMNSLTRKFDPNHIEVPSRTTLVFGSRVGYGIYHASTAPRPSGLPYRPPLVLTDADRVALIKGIQAELLGRGVPALSFGGSGSVASSAADHAHPLDRLGFGGSGATMEGQPDFSPLAVSFAEE